MTTFEEHQAKAGRAGGTARKASNSKEQLSEQGRKAAAARWAKEGERKAIQSTRKSAQDLARIRKAQDPG